MPSDVSPAGDSATPSTTRNDLQLVLSKIPVVGEYLAILPQLSSKARRLIFAVTIFLLIYPIISFCIVMLVLRFSPNSVQASARDFILAALGVGDETDSEINQNNKLIDAEIPLNFNQDGTDVYYQTVSPLQRIEIEGIIKTSALPKQTGNCSTVRLNNDKVVGHIEVETANSSFQGSYPVRAYTEQVVQIASIDAKEWANFKAAASQESDRYPLRISFQQDPSLSIDPYFHCYSFGLSVNLTIYKPSLGLIK